MDAARKQECGVFYVIQLTPELDPHRVKFGFAANLDRRLKSHRCAAPTAAVLCHWPCKRSWEAAAITVISQGCRKLRSEVFRASDLDAVQNRGDAFFELMGPAIPSGLLAGCRKSNRYLKRRCGKGRSGERLYLQVPVPTDLRGFFGGCYTIERALNTDNLVVARRRRDGMLPEIREQLEQARTQSEAIEAQIAALA